MSSPHIPTIGIQHLDQLWFQVAGTRCNLTCNHCFISCSPKNNAFHFLSLKQIQERLRESVSLGVKEYYFTGGEPFINPEMVDILTETLQYGPATVLTNATVLKGDWLRQLHHAESASHYGLEFRVSLDGFSPQTNDPIRGDGTFDRAMAGVRLLVNHGFLPIITAVRTWGDEQDIAVVRQFSETLRSNGYDRPRLKILPTLQIGAEEARSGGYSVLDRVTPKMMENYDESLLICHNSRIITDRGVHVCPILIDSPDSLLSDRLADSLQCFPMSHGACYTCYRYGSICSNATGRSLERSQTSTQSIERKLTK